jgi:hypothetical protein
MPLVAFVAPAERPPYPPNPIALVYAQMGRIGAILDEYEAIADACVAFTRRGNVVPAPGGSRFLVTGPRDVRGSRPSELSIALAWSNSIRAALNEECALAEPAPNVPFRAAVDMCDLVAARATQAGLEEVRMIALVSATRALAHDLIGAQLTGWRIHAPAALATAVAATLTLLGATQPYTHVRWNATQLAAQLAERPEISMPVRDEIFDAISSVDDAELTEARAMCAQLPDCAIAIIPIDALNQFITASDGQRQMRFIVRGAGPVVLERKGGIAPAIATALIGRSVIVIHPIPGKHEHATWIADATRMRVTHSHARE